MSLWLVGVCVSVLWTAEAWITYPDTEFVLLQLSYVFELLKDRQCVLPPAQGDVPGLVGGMYVCMYVFVFV